jgi:putative serine/threonine protein kinase
MYEFIGLDNLEDEYFKSVICYPTYDSQNFTKRLLEMKKLGIKALCFSGEKKIGALNVLGKGGVGIVVLAKTKTDLLALKIRRIDANKLEMKHEADMLKIANSFHIGPKLHSYSKNLLMMDFIEGSLFPKWIQKMEDNQNSRIKIRNVYKDLLNQCWVLDKVGLDHGELCHPPNHIIIDVKDKIHILDFETASTKRKVSNLTSICQYLFFSLNRIFSSHKTIDFSGGEDLIKNLRVYKRKKNKINFTRVLNFLLLHNKSF